MKLSNRIKASGLMTLMLFSASNLFAGAPPPPPPPPAGIPVDAGAALLLLVGAVLGIKKLYKRNKEKQVIASLEPIAQKARN